LCAGLPFSFQGLMHSLQEWDGMDGGKGKRRSSWLNTALMTSAVNIDGTELDFNLT